MKLYQASVLVAAITVLAAFVVFNSQKEGVSQYVKWKNQFKYPINSEVQDNYREIIFNSNVDLINSHNSDPSRTFNKGINQFTGLTQQEFASTYLMTFDLQIPKIEKESQQFQLFTLEIDWVALGAVTPIKNQGQCSSCWAFSAVGAVQGAKKLATGKLTSLSEQQLVDCSGKYGNYGCNGGKVTSSYLYIKQKGLYTSEAYPYKAIKQECKSPPGQLYKILNFTEVKSCTDLNNAIALRPVSVIVDGAQWSSYSNGVFNKCGGTAPNLGVLLVGVVGGALKIKNSWGDSWGEHGYIRLSTQLNCCGVCNFGSYPIPLQSQ